MTLSINPSSLISQLKARTGVKPAGQAVPPRSRVQSTTNAKRGDNQDTLVANIGDGTDAINFILVAASCPAKYRPFIDAVVGLAGDRTEWFEATDAEVGMRARGGEDSSRDGACKWVQRHRKDLCEWQTVNNLALIECSPGGQAPDGERYPSRYKVNLLTLAAATVEEARGTSLWKRDPSRAVELAAQRIIEDTPETPAYKPRFRAPRSDDEAKLARHPKTAATLLCEVARIMGERGEDFPAWLDEYTQSLKIKANVHTIQKDQWTNPSIGEAEESHGGRAEEIEPSPVEARDEAEQAVTDACEAFDVVSSVGASRFTVTMKDDESGRATAEHVTLAEVAAKLPDYFMQNASGHESFIVRPEGAALIQVDDCAASERDLLAPFAFMVAETSADNYQAWLALPEETSDEDRRRVRERLFAGALLGTSANVGAGGAMRWIGSFNCKPERRRADGSLPRVRLVQSSFARFTTEAELETNGLLAPHAPREIHRPKLGRPMDRNVPRTPPSYEKCLQSVRLKKNGKPDRSFADLLFAVTCFDWKFDFDEIVTLLKQVSEKAKRRRDNYAEQTVRLAMIKAGL